MYHPPGTVLLRWHSSNLQGRSLIEISFFLLYYPPSTDTMDDSTPVMQAPMPPGMLAFTTFLSLVTFAVQAVCISKFQWCKETEFAAKNFFSGRRIKFAWRGLTLTYWCM